VELNEPTVTVTVTPVTATERVRARARRAAALLVAAAVLGAGCCARTASAATPAPHPAAAHVQRTSHAAHARHRPARATRPRGGPDASGRCPTDLGRIACVDLTRQLMWVQVGSRVVFGPVRVRTGRAGYVTRTGLWHVYRRNKDQWSTLYDVAMPYSQFFSGGEAFHGLNGESMSTPPGSHGCVNMNTWDARRLWGVLKHGDPVQVFGRKPGT